MRAIASCSLVVGFLISVAPSVRAGDLHVPADYLTIQAAINAAADGDAVLVSPGTYFETINFVGKGITVQSTDGPTVTTIDGSQNDSVVKFITGEDANAVLEGFTITNGKGHDYGGGVYIENASPTVRNNVITGNHARDNGGGMFIRYSAPIVLDNVISYNSSSADGGGVTIAEGSDGLVFSGNFVLANNAAEQGGGIHFVDSVSRMTPLTNNTIVSNSGTSGGGIFFHGSSSSLITNSILWYNSPDSIDAEALAGPVIANSDIEGGWSGTANIDLDPVFVDAVGGNYHLTATSPCIDSGDLNAPNLPTSDIDGDPRILGHGVDMGFDEARLFPYVAAVTPNRGRYDTSPSVSVLGSGFSFGTFPQVFFGQVPALNVVLVDGQTITCDVPAGEPGPICVTVSNDYGDGVLSNGFTYTPAVTIEGDTHVGSTITIHDLCDAGDGIFAVYGLPPQVSIPTPPFDGDLAIVPFHYLFYVPVWPFDSFDLPATIPSDPALVGVDVLLQSLIGPRLTTRPKDGRWTNCAVLSIL